MGKIITVWSNSKKSGRTVFTYLLAQQMMEQCERELSIIVCCLNYKYSGLYKLLGVKPSEIGLEDIANHMLGRQQVDEGLLKAIPKVNGISFLGSFKSTNTFTQKYIEQYKQTFLLLKDIYDIVLVDTAAGRGNTLTNYLLQASSVVMDLMTQDVDSLMEQGGSLVNEKEAFYSQIEINILNQYRDIYPRSTDVKEKLSLSEISVLPYCKTLQEMKNKNNLLLYQQHDTEYNHTMRALTKRVIKDLGIENKQTSSVKEMGISSLGFINRLKLRSSRSST